MGVAGWGAAYYPAQATKTKHHRQGSSTGTLFAHSLKSGKSKIKVWADSVLDENFFLGVQTGAQSGVLTGQREPSRLSGSLFIRALILCGGTPPS